MKTKNMSLVLLTGLLVMVMVAGCAAPAAAPLARPTAARPVTGSVRPTIAIISKHDDSSPFWQTVWRGAKKAAQDFSANITFDGPADEAEVDQQLEMLQKALDKKPAAICLAAVDSQAVIPLLQKARDAQVPVIGFDSGVDSDIPVTTAATDNIAAAETAADHMAQLIGNAGEVAIIAQDQTSQSGLDRVQGFTDEIKTKYPNITIVSIDYGAGDVLKSSLIAKTVIQAHPNLKGYFGANEGSVDGLLNAVRILKKEGQIVVVGYDSGTLQIDAIRSGVEAGAITQDPIGIGYKCVEAAVKAMNGETLPKAIDTGWHWYDKSNIDDPALAPLVYQ